MVTHTLISTLGRHRQADLCEFKDNLVYRVSARTSRYTEKPSLKKIKIKEIELKIKPCRDKKIHRVWILNIIVLSLNGLIVEEGTTAD